MDSPSTPRMLHFVDSDDDRTPRASTFAPSSQRLNYSPAASVELGLAPYPPPSRDLPPVSTSRTRSQNYIHPCAYLKRNISELGFTPAGVDVIYWEEDADTLDAMLRFVYPDRPKPKVESVPHLRFLLETARRYGIGTATHVLCTTVLLDFATKDPLSVFAIACEFGLTNEAALISKETLKVDFMMDQKSSELGRVSLSYYHRLHRLHRLRAAKAIDIINLINTENPMDEPDPPYCEGCGTNAIWWQIFVEYAGIELKRRPVTDTIFSTAFLARCVRSSRGICGKCIDSYMHAHSQSLLTRLKEDIDALPAYISA
ncbi:hypothetical protein RHS01_02765 [Rhizoctonia solani]|uniref:BTB domain-containing protein n=1 Tax=Rhizoctonia solani TaxID=456999 RepID=A0A8H7M7A1_9AGAM|nr:hypothetical protein RHS01_02765 [Rhizoctonia solani]